MIYLFCAIIVFLLLVTVVVFVGITGEKSRPIEEQLDEAAQARQRRYVTGRAEVTDADAMAWGEVFEAMRQVGPTPNQRYQQELGRAYRENSAGITEPTPAADALPAEAPDDSCGFSASGFSMSQASDLPAEAPDSFSGWTDTGSYDSGGFDSSSDCGSSDCGGCDGGSSD